MSFPTYAHYKDSGVEWLGEVPAHWGISTIKHIVATPVTDGPHETPQFFDEGIPFVSAEAVSGGFVNFEKIRGHISELDHARYSEKYKPKRGDIFMVKSGATTGLTAIVETDQDFNIWSPLAVIRSCDKFEPYYVLNFMRSKNFQEAVTLFWSFGTQQNIGMGVIENLEIAFPPIDEQREIAQFLTRETTKLDALITEQRTLIDLLKEKRQAVISHAVTKGLDAGVAMKDSGVEWLGEVPAHWDVVRNKVVFSEIDERNVDGDGILMTVSHITGVTPRSEKNVNMILAESLEGYKCAKAGDLVINTMWAWMGALGMSPCDGLFSPSYNVYRPRYQDRINPDYYDFICRVPRHITAMKANSSGIWESRLRLYPNVFLSMFVCIPPVQEQRTISREVERKVIEFDQLVNEAEIGIDLLQERRSALISAAVTGKIDVRQAA